MNSEIINGSLIIEEPEGSHGDYVEDINKSIGYFRENPYRSLGNSDSGHGVLFGELGLYGQVAVKPFPTLLRAKHEKEILNHILSYHPKLDAICPIEVSTNGVFVYLITKYRQGLRHYGQLPWYQDITSRKLRHVISPVLGNIAEATSKLHLFGITHGDMQPKNISYDDNGPVWVDLENGQAKLSGNELYLKSNKDYERFGVSVLRRGLLEDRSLKYRVGYLRDNFISRVIELESSKIDQTNREKIITENISRIYQKITNKNGKRKKNKNKN
jgi:hypothetical protein